MGGGVGLHSNSWGQCGALGVLRKKAPSHSAQPPARGVGAYALARGRYESLRRDLSAVPDAPAAGTGVPVVPASRKAGGRAGRSVPGGRTAAEGRRTACGQFCGPCGAALRTHEWRWWLTGWLARAGPGLEAMGHRHAAQGVRAATLARAAVTAAAVSGEAAAALPAAPPRAGGGPSGPRRASPPLRARRRRFRGNSRILVTGDVWGGGRCSRVSGQQAPWRLAPAGPGGS